MEASNAPAESFATEAERVGMLRAAALTRALEAAIRKGKVHPNDRDHVMSRTQEAIWKAKYIPTDADRGLKYCCGIARRVSKRWNQEERRRVDYAAASLDERAESAEAAPSDEPATDLESQLAARMDIARLEGLVTASQRRTLAWLARFAIGITLEEIAGEEGLPVGTVSAAVSRLRTNMNERLRQLVILLLAAIGVPVVLHGQIRAYSEVGVGHEDWRRAAWLPALVLLTVSVIAFFGLARLRRASTSEVVGAAVGSACFLAIALQLRAYAYVDGPLLPVAGLAVMFGGLGSMLLATSRSRTAWGCAAAAVLASFVAAVLAEQASRVVFDGGLRLFPGSWDWIVQLGWFWALTLFPSVGVGGWIGRARGAGPAVHGR